MAQLSRTNLKTKYNDSSTGLYKDNSTKAITASRVRTNVDDEADSALFWEDVIDEDNFSTDSATRPPSQQSVRVYADAIIGVGTTSGTNSYTVNVGSPKTILTSGYLYAIKWAAASTGAVTLDIQSSGAKKVFKDPTTQAGNGDLVQNSISLMMYQSTLDGGTGGYLIIGGVGGGSGAIDSVNGQTGVVVLDAGDIAFTPGGTIAATDVQGAIDEIGTEKLALSGGTMTGNIAMSGTQKLTGLAAGTSNGDSVRFEQLPAPASASVSGIGKLYTGTGSNTDGSMTQNAITNELATKLLIVNSASALTDASTIDLTAAKHTLSSSSATRTFTISYTGDDIVIEVTLSTTSATYTFPATALCVSEGFATGDNTLPLTGASGDKYIITVKKVGSNYYVVSKNFGQ